MKEPGHKMWHTLFCSLSTRVLAYEIFTKKEVGVYKLAVLHDVAE